MKLPLTREMRTLPNGMKVILIHKKNFTRSLFMIGIPAGSTNLVDQIGDRQVVHPQGCAHYLEHQMFRLHGEDVTYALAAARAKTNAATSYDETCYYVWTNADPYTPLGLLIDFVQTLDITGQSVEKEKGIILSEYDQYNQDPESRLLTETFRCLYQAHPMREDILGRPEDIQAMTPEDLQAFYETWYDPSQLVLVGVTGHELNPIFEFIEKKEEQFVSRSLCRAVKVIPQEPAEVAEKKKAIKLDVDLSYACLGVKLPAVPESPAVITRNDYMLNLWLAGTFSSMNPEFQQWLDSHLVGSMSGAEADVARDHAYILIYAQTDDPKRYFEVMKTTLEKKRPLSPEAFESLLIREKASSIRLADRFEGLASQLVEGFFTGSDPLDDLAILNSITLEDLTRYIDGLDFEAQCEVQVVPLLEPSMEMENLPGGSKMD